MVGRRGRFNRAAHTPRLALQSVRPVSRDPQVIAVSSELQRRVTEGPLTPFQLLAIGVCVCLNMVDGFDILAMLFAASGIKSDWHLTDSQLGYLFSAGLVGMGIGSLSIAPWADRLGRRPSVLLSVAIAGLGMVGSVAASGFAPLLLLRVLTGVGIGGTIASVAVAVSEYAAIRWHIAEHRRIADLGRVSFSVPRWH
jgi:MFS family permease